MGSLSRRFLVLTVIFVMLAEVLIFVPSVARFREEYLLARLERAQIASLAVEASAGMIDDALRQELLDNAGVLNVVLRRDEVSQLMLTTAGIPDIATTIDLREATAWSLVRDGMRRLFVAEEETIRVIGLPTQGGGTLIDFTMSTAPLRAAMLDYGVRILILSAVISVFTAALLFFAVQRLMVHPIRRVVSHMTAYADDPQDTGRIIEVEARVRELREAEEALNTLQTQLTGALRQRERLVKLGEAVAKISHDLRNILNTATLVADRLENSEDPGVRRVTPRLLRSLSRAVNLCESALAFGRAEEPPPRLARIDLSDLVADVVENERLASDGPSIAYRTDVEPGLIARVDAEQMHRVLANLIGNARQAITTSGAPGTITVSAFASDDIWEIAVSDTGPGLPKKAQDHLFQPFQGTARKGGSGLGLVIANELVRGHGGSLKLHETGPDGTTFRICLPAGTAPSAAA
ncbi:MAG: HAMP domain-containing sensor histidine kinase [Pseudomonadota bacterium]